MTFNFERAWVRVSLCLASMGLPASCAIGCAPASAPDAEPIATVHQAQCGRCHTPPAPHHLAKGYLEDAFSRHRGRVHLSEEEWAAMVDYLAAGSARLDDRPRATER